jgi:hypothetical protein
LRDKRIKDKKEQQTSSKLMSKAQPRILYNDRYNKQPSSQPESKHNSHHVIFNFNPLEKSFPA